MDVLRRQAQHPFRQQRICMMRYSVTAHELNEASKQHDVLPPLRVLLVQETP